MSADAFDVPAYSAEPLPPPRRSRQGSLDENDPAQSMLDTASTFASSIGGWFSRTATAAAATVTSATQDLLKPIASEAEEGGGGGDETRKREAGEEGEDGEEEGDENRTTSPGLVTMFTSAVLKVARDIENSEIVKEVGKQAQTIGTNIRDVTNQAVDTVYSTLDPQFDEHYQEEIRRPQSARTAAAGGDAERDADDEKVNVEEAGTHAPDALDSIVKGLDFASEAFASALKTTGGKLKDVSRETSAKLVEQGLTAIETLGERAMAILGVAVPSPNEVLWSTPHSRSESGVYSGDRFAAAWSRADATGRREIVGRLEVRGKGARAALGSAEGFNLADSAAIDAVLSAEAMNEDAEAVAGTVSVGGSIGTSVFADDAKIQSLIEAVSKVSLKRSTKWTDALKDLGARVRALGDEALEEARTKGGKDEAINACATLHDIAVDTLVVVSETASVERNDTLAAGGVDEHAAVTPMDIAKNVRELGMAWMSELHSTNLYFSKSLEKIPAVVSVESDGDMGAVIQIVDSHKNQLQSDTDAIRTSWRVCIVECRQASGLKRADFPVRKTITLQTRSNGGHGSQTGRSFEVLDEKKAGDIETGDEPISAEDAALALDAEIADASLANKLTSAIVPQIDDPDTPHLSARVWILGTLWCAGMAAANAIFSFRTNSITLDPTLAVLLTYPLGLILAKILPTSRINIGKFSFTLNPGPFSIKEHVLISVMASAGSASPYALCNVVSQGMDMFMANEDRLPSVFLLGHHFTALFVSLHKPDLKLNTWKMSRFSFFWIALAGIFIYELIPNVFATSLQAVALLCLFSSSKIARFLGSVSPPVSGAGLLGLTFDLQYIGTGVFLVPWIYQLQSWIGNYIFVYLVAIPMYFTNPFGHPDTLWRGIKRYIIPGTNDTKPLAISMPSPITLNVTKYNEVGPIYISDLFAVTYLVDFIVLPAMVAHVVVWYGKDIVRQFKAAVKQINDETDIHNKLMASYADIPEWFYGGWLLIWTIALCLVCAFTEFRMPVWGVLLGHRTQIYLNVLQEFVAGLLMPGDTVAVMCYKSVGFNTAYPAITLLADLQQGHYLKIPPISMFAAQIYGTISLTGKFLAITFYNAGAIWGAIAPARFFGIGSVYQNLLWGFLVGAAAPVFVWAASKYYPSKNWHLINIPLIVYIGGSNQYQNFYIVAPLMGFIFSYYILKKNPDWWKKYNYVLAAAQAGGVAAAVLFASALTANGVNFPIWALKPDPNASYFDYYCYNIDAFGNPNK
ncbi:OPT oligopeptide transporter protein-domain-containing protein [Cladochytrium replicatum]|nr:OPT oligopeptide transporter protein-domain-containing protein [Cladochytrium replicatum]